MMRRRAGLFWAAAAAVLLAAPSESAAVGLGRAVTAKAGAEVRLRFAKTISSANARVGQTVELRVSQDVTADGVVALAAGSEAWGVVSAVAPPGRLNRDGVLEIELQGACLADGSAVRLRAAPAGGDADESRTAARDAGYALPALPVLVFLYGKDVEASAGQETLALLDETRTLDANAFAGGPVTGCRQLTQQAAGSRVSVRSNPLGAEIRVDGVYAGDTPSELSLPAGNHRLEVVREGYRVWERTIRLTPGGDVNVSATLERHAPAKGKE